MRFALATGLALGLMLPLPALAANGDQAPLNTPPGGWSFEGPLGTYNRTDLQHGFQVYKEVCSACHSLNRVAFHTLDESGGPEFTEPQAKAIAAGYKLPADPNDKGETVDEIAHESQAIFVKAGGDKLHLCPCLNDHPTWVAAMRTIIAEEGQGWLG